MTNVSYIYTQHVDVFAEVEPHSVLPVHVITPLNDHYSISVYNNDISHVCHYL